jgi:hypothetical protein
MTNCYQHQLYETLNDECDLKTIELHNLGSIDKQLLQKAHSIISCLKLRTLLQSTELIKSVIGNREIKIYDQDPWEAFKDDGPYKGAYQKISNDLNVKLYAVTVRWWAEYMKSQGYPAKFVKIWTLPRYCSSNPAFEQRKIDVGFIGSLHPHRKIFFDNLAKMGINVSIIPPGRTYEDFLNILSTIKIFIHSANLPFTVNGENCNLKKGLWAKELDSCSRGCFSIRDEDPDGDSFFTSEQFQTVRLFSEYEQIPNLIEEINDLNVNERNLQICSTVDFIQKSNQWIQTASTLIE